MMWILKPKIQFHIWSQNGLFNSVRGNKFHEALDLCAEYGTEGLAPENGKVVWHWIERNGKSKPRITWPFGALYFYGAWCSYPYGGVTVLYGNSGNVYLYCHMNLKQIQNITKANNVKLYTGIHSAGDRMVKIYHTLADIKSVKAGAVVAKVGNAGQSTEPHFHFEAWKDDGRFDPLKLWPEMKKEIENNFWEY